MSLTWEIRLHSLADHLQSFERSLPWGLLRQHGLWSQFGSIEYEASLGTTFSHLESAVWSLADDDDQRFHNYADRARVFFLV